MKKKTIAWIMLAMLFIAIMIFLIYVYGIRIMWCTLITAFVIGWIFVIVNLMVADEEHKHGGAE